MRYMIEYAPAKTGGYPNSKLRMLQNYLRGNEHISSLHLGRKYVRIFFLGHYTFPKASSFQPAVLSNNAFRSVFGTDNVRRQMSELVFTPTGDHCLYIPHDFVV